MNFTIETNRNLKSFGWITYGTLFLDEEGIPYIRVVEFTRDCDCGYVYNSICLSTGEGRKFNENETVNIPSGYELKIFT